MNKVLLACSLGVGIILPTPAHAQDGTTETSVFVCAPCPQDPGCESWEDDDLIGCEGFLEEEPEESSGSEEIDDVIITSPAEPITSGVISFAG